MEFPVPLADLAVAAKDAGLRTSLGDRPVAHHPGSHPVRRHLRQVRGSRGQFVDDELFT